MRRSKGVLGGALALCAVLLGARVADAGTTTVQATTGHPSNSTGLGNVFAVDGEVCGTRDIASTAWWIPIQLSVTNTTYTGSQFSSNASGFAPVVSTRMVSFRPDNSVFQVGAFMMGSQSGAGSSIGSVFVPTDGTLLTQTTVFGLSCLASIKVTY